MHQPQPNKDTQAAQIMGLGIMFLAIPLILIISRHPDANSTEFWMYRIIASLGAAAIGGSLPGLVAIDRAGIKATGAVALFVIVFFTTPKGAAPTPTPQPVIPQNPAVDPSVGRTKPGTSQDATQAHATRPTEPLRRSEFRRLGDDALDEHNTDDARAWYEAALCLDDHEVGTRDRLERLPPPTGGYVFSLRTVSRKLMDLRKLQCAERLLREALNYASADPAQTHYLLGLALKGESRIDEAVSELRQAEQLLGTPEPSCASGGIYTWLGYLHEELGWALQSKGQFDEALTEFNKARPCLGPGEWLPKNPDEVRSGQPSK
jgi:hypothetical protein